MIQTLSGKTVTAAVLVVAALFSVVDVASKALAERLHAVRARAGGLADRLDRLRAFRQVGATWLEAWTVSARPAIAGGAVGAGSHTYREKVVRLKADGTNYTAAAGASNINSEVLDTQGFDGVRFLVGWGAITSGGAQSIKVQQGQVANLSDAADLLGSAQTVADTDDNLVTSSEIFRPQERYLRVAILRATQNSVIDFVLAILYAKQGLTPITQHATIQGTPEVFASPAEGTA